MHVGATFGGNLRDHAASGNPPSCKVASKAAVSCNIAWLDGRVRVQRAALGVAVAVTGSDSCCAPCSSALSRRRVSTTASSLWYDGMCT